MENTAFFRFHGELEDFLAPKQREQILAHHFQGHPGIKDPIETFGVPHSEVALIEVNGLTAGHGYQLQPNDHADSEIVQLGVEEERIILTRDRRLLFHKIIAHGYWIRTVKPVAQVQEIMKRIGLADVIHPFRRCLECNGLIYQVEKAAIIAKLEPLTRKYYDEYFQCQQCGQVYWKGSHYPNLIQKLEQFKSHA